MDARDRRRLLIVSQPLQAGVPRHVLDLVRRLDPAIFEVNVACPRVAELWPALAGLGHVRLHAIAPHREPALIDGMTWARLLPLVRRADVIHAHSSKAGFVTRLAAAAQGRAASCIFTPHGWSFWAARGAKAAVYRSLERLAARWCRTILTVSEHERRAGLQCKIGVPDQYRVVRNGIDLRRFTRPPSPVRGRVLMVGRLAPQKRSDLVLRAVASLQSRFPELELHLVGDGPDRRAIEALVARLGINGRVQLMGTRNDIPALLSAAQCLILASDYEACPLAVMEGMAAGVAVVATRVGDVPELVDDGITGVLVEPGAPEQLAAGLAGLLNDPERARRIGDAARRKARAEFSSAGMVDAITRIYRDATGTSRSRQGTVAESS